MELAEETPGPDADAISTIDGLLAEELEPRRQAVLKDLKNELLAARINTASARQETAKSLLLSGVVFLDSILRDQAAINRSRENLSLLLSRMRVSSPDDADRMRPVIDAGIDRLNTLRETQRTSVTSLRQALEFLSTDLTPNEITQTFDLLRRELTVDGQTRLLSLVENLRSDLGRFTENPTMDTDMLLAMILQI